jgi:hypothetical protein
MYEVGTQDYSNWGYEHLFSGPWLVIVSHRISVFNLGSSWCTSHLHRLLWIWRHLVMFLMVVIGLTVCPPCVSLGPCNKWRPSGADHLWAVLSWLFCTRTNLICLFSPRVTVILCNSPVKCTVPHLFTGICDVFLVFARDGTLG